MADQYNLLDGNSQHIGTGDGGRRHTAITSKGTIWTSQRTAVGGIGFYTSTNNGATFGWLGAQSQIFDGQITCGAEYSFFIDESDLLHLVYQKYVGNTDGRTYSGAIVYRYANLTPTHAGVLNWSSEFVIVGSDYWHSPDVVAHRHTDGDIRVHIAFNYNWAGDNRHIAVYGRLKIGYATGSITSESLYFVHDAYGANFPGKISIDYSHSGNGKGVRLDAGGNMRVPSIYLSYTFNYTPHIGRLDYNGSTWVTGHLTSIPNGGSGNTPSGVTNALNGGLYEHHRWTRTLYDAREDRAIVAGFLANNGHSYQALCIYEYDSAGNLIVGVNLSGGNWGANYALPHCIGGTASLSPNGSLYMFGTTAWNSNYGVGRLEISRPLGSTTRNVIESEVIETEGTTSNAARAFSLPYPQGERHDFYAKANNDCMYWRNNRGCDYIALGTIYGRRPKYLLKNGGWVPVQTRDRASFPA